MSPLRTDDALVAAIREAPVPVVVIGRSLEQQGIDSVSTDSAAGLGQAVAHLLEIGRRRIGFVNGPLDTTPGAARQRGFDAATSAPAFAGEHTDAESADDFTVAAGLAAARRLLDRGARRRPFDAIVAANDLLAIGVIHAAGERARRAARPRRHRHGRHRDRPRVPPEPDQRLPGLGRARSAAAQLVLDRVGGTARPDPARGRRAAPPRARVHRRPGRRLAGQTVMKQTTAEAAPRPPPRPPQPAAARAGPRAAWPGPTRARPSRSSSRRCCRSSS